MNKETMQQAKVEAQRFLKAIKQMEEELKENPRAFWGCPASGNLRRKSMDLTRALSALRKGDSWDHI